MVEGKKDMPTECVRIVLLKVVVNSLPDLHRRIATK